jgi:two-component system sensor histidine kinase/response regulator
VLAAGMDDFIPKPVDASTLERALLHWTGTKMPDKQPDNDNAALQPTAAVAPARPSDVDAGAQLKPRLVEIFLRVAPVQLAELRAQVVAREADAARTLAHTLKGGLYAVSAAALADELEALRRELGARTWDQVDSRFQQIETRFSALARWLQLSAAAPDPQVRANRESA